MKKFFSLILTFLLLAGAAVAVFSAEVSPFSDVKTSRWSYGAIKYAVEKGYMNGIGDGKFDPAGSMTRGMVVTVLYRREGSPAVTFRNDFTDVKAGKYYSDAVIWAKDEGVVNGVTETTFEPKGKITREQLATMLSRFSERCLVSVPERADLSGYPDSDKIHNYAKDALAWANEANLIKGMSDGTLSPRGEATREQFATILKRFDDTFDLIYNTPVARSHYTEPEYPLVDDADVYVATDGSDENPGTFEAPVATFNRAVELVRGIKATKTDGDIVVAFKAGDYGPLSVTLTAEDAGTAEQRIIYCKYGDGDVTFDNGTTVTEDEFVPLDEADKALFIEKNVDMIKKADAKGRLDDYTLFDLVLSEKGEMAVARFPNRYDDGTDHLQQGGYTVDDHHIAVSHALLKNRISKYHTTEGLHLYGFITLGWYKDLMETDGCEYDEETGNYVFFMPHPENTRGGRLRLEEGFADDYYQMAIVNMSEELDAGDEFWFDRSTDTLYVYDPSGDYFFVNGGDMITMDHADNVSFIGLTLRNTRERMINATASHGVTVDGCVFSGSASPSAVYICGCESGRPFDVTVRNSDFSYTASYALDVEMFEAGAGRHGGMRVGELLDTGGGVLIDNNRFYKSSLVVGNTGAVGVDAVGPVVTHNLFTECCWCGLDYSGTVNMLAAYNIFDRVSYNGEDTGALNTWYSTDYCGNVIRNNLFVSTGFFGLYLDDVVGNRVESNVFFDMSQTTSMNNGICKYNTFCNNVVINPDRQEGMGCDYRTGGTSAVLNAMDGNDDPSVLTSVGDYGRWKGTLEFYYDHPDMMARLSEMWPGYFDITLDVTRWREPEYCSNNSLVITGNREINETGAEKVYDDLISLHSVIEDNLYYSVGENPLFVNPTIGDYRIREGVDFPDIEFEKIGRY